MGELRLFTKGCGKFQPVAQSDREGRKAYYADLDWREQFKEKAGNGGKIGDRWARTEISWFPTDTSMEGKNVQELADELGQDPVDVMLDMALDADLDMRIVQDVVNHDRDEIDELSRPHHGHRTIRRRRMRVSCATAKYSTEFLSTFVREREL